MLHCEVLQLPLYIGWGYGWCGMSGIGVCVYACACVCGSKNYVCTFRIHVITTSVTEHFWPRGPPRGQARVQDGVQTSYMDAAFVLLVHKGSEIWTNQSPLFTQIGLLQLQRD